MKLGKDDRGFNYLAHPTCLGPSKGNVIIAKESSACDETSRHDDIPGSSRLWLGDHHLTADDVEELMRYLNAWLVTGHLDGSVEGR